VTGAAHRYRWKELFKDAAPVAGDEVIGPWPRAQLLEMDRKFVERLGRAIARGRERPSAAASAPQEHLAAGAAPSVPQQEGERPHA